MHGIEVGCFLHGCFVVLYELYIIMMPFVVEL